MQSERISFNSIVKESRIKLGSIVEIALAIKELSKKHLENDTSEKEKNSFAYAVGALIALTKRKICPGSDSSISKLIEITLTSMNAKPLDVDTTNFARVLTSIANDSTLNAIAENIAFQSDFITLYKNLSENKDLNQQLVDPLLVGWLNQIQIKSRQHYDERRQKKSLNELASLTQWYTPEWIAKILTTDVLSDHCLLSNSKVTFLDPAAGTGHLLVPAYLYLLSNSNKSIKAVSNILQNQIFGLDIDSKAIEIAGFSIYLVTRDRTEKYDYPVPKLFSFGDESKSFGSYLLGTKQDSKSRILVSLEGESMTLDTIPHKFDAIAANPPYLSNRLIPKSLKSFLKKNYKESHYDLYTSFLDLSIRLLSKNGRASFICQQSFLSIHRYEGLRRNLLKQCKLKSVAQLGKGIFATRSGEKVNSAIITFSKEQKSDRDMVTVLSKNGDFLNPYQKPYKEFETIFTSIPGFPLAIWCPEEIASLFKSCPPLENPNSGIICTNGLFTCNNQRFVKHFSQLSESDKKNFVPYDKGGAKKWFFTTPYFLEWKNKGADIRDYRKKRGQSAALPGEDYYFKPGITYSYIGPSGFKARLLSPNSIFDIASSAIFCSHDNLLYLLGFLNSSLVRFILGILNPTVNFQIGDLRKLPYIEPDQLTKSRVSELSKKAIAIAKKFEKYNVDSPAFDKNLVETVFYSHSKSESSVESAKTKLLEEVNLARMEELEIQKQIDEQIYNLYNISNQLKLQISQDPWVNQDTFSQLNKLDYKKMFAPFEKTSSEFIETQKELPVPSKN